MNLDEHVIHSGGWIARPDTFYNTDIKEFPVRLRKLQRYGKYVEK